MKLNFLVLAIAVLVSYAGNAQAQQAVSLTLDPASAAINRFDIAVDVGGGALNGSQSSDFSGSIDILLNLIFDSSNVATTTGLEFTGGVMSATDTSISLGLFSVDLIGLQGNLYTPLPPGPVSGNTFDAANHNLLINQGTIMAAGTTLDLSTDPAESALVGSGQLDVTLNNIAADLATYDVLLTMPVFLNDSFLVNIPGIGDTTVAVTVDGGDVVARGQFTHPVPEPGSLSVIGLSCLLFGVRRRRSAMA